MASPDADYCELYVTVKSYFTGLPYIDTNLGISSQNIPYESCSITDVMYEPKANTMASASIVFPTIIQNPNLRPLLSQIKEGDRVEIYHFQPDVGLPVFAGFIPPGGLTIQSGKMQIDLQDCMGRGQWERIRPYEDFDTDAAGYYNRAMHRWHDYLNEDFNLAAAGSQGAYIVTYNMTGEEIYIKQGAWHLPAQGTAHIMASNFTGSPKMSLTPGTKILIEARGQSFTDYAFQTPQAGKLIDNTLGLSNGTDTIYLEEIYLTDTGAPQAGKVNRLLGVTANSQTVPLNYTTNVTNGLLPFDALPQPANNLYAVLLVVEDDGSVTVSAFVNYIQVVPPVNTSIASPDGWYFVVNTEIPSLGGGLVAANTYQEWNSFRVRQLVPWLNKAAQFNPQTKDATEFQANNDDLYTFLNNFVEIDFAEYRPIYQSYPTLDLLELDGVGLLGKNASLRLGMDQFMDESAPRVGGVMGTDTAQFFNTPPFRFEEGWNLSDFPQINKSQLNHSNNIVRMGSGNTDAQTFYDRWNTGEVGNPFGQTFGTITGSAPTYPYFETLINDDRTSLTDVIGILAANDLTLRAAPLTPSLSLTVAEDIKYAFKWRAGDFVRVKTQSLINNVDQDLRVMSVSHVAGQPSRQVTVGRLAYDPALRSLMARSMVESWLYTQSGAGQLVLIYPFVPVTLTAGSLGPTFQVPLNQFTSGTAITYASFHWFTNGSDPVGDIAIAIGGDPSLANASILETSAPGQDSNLQNAVGYFPGPGVYYVAPKNIGGSSRTVNSLFLVLKVKL